MSWSTGNECRVRGRRDTGGSKLSFAKYCCFVSKIHELERCLCLSYNMLNCRRKFYFGFSQLPRHKFETHELEKLIWVPGSPKVDDPLTKKYSILIQDLRSLMFDCTLPISPASCELRDSNTPRRILTIIQTEVNFWMRTRNDLVGWPCSKFISNWSILRHCAEIFRDGA